MIEDNIPPFSESTNGYIWFAIDTGRIYLDTSSERVTVGGNGAAIIYGNFPSSVEPDEAGFYSFNISDLEENSPKPHADDLILNADGTFYKVVEIQSDEILICKIVSVSGGGSGSGGVATGSRTSLTIKPVSNTNLINNQEIEIEFVAAAEKDSEGNYTDDSVNVTWVLEEAVGNNLYQQYMTGSISGVANNVATKLVLTDKLRTSTTSRIRKIPNLFFNIIKSN